MGVLFVAVNVLRTTQYIHRIRSIDIISLWEIFVITHRAFISIENETPPYAIARRAFISIENETPPYAIANRAFISIENETPPYAIARRAFISIENETPPYAIARRAITKKTNRNVPVSPVDSRLRRYDMLVNEDIYITIRLGDFHLFCMS